MHSLKIIGIKGKNYNALLQILKNTIERMELDFSLTEINQIDHIINEEVQAIPAILLNEKILFCQNGHQLEEKELEHLIQRAISSNETHLNI